MYVKKCAITANNICVESSSENPVSLFSGNCSKKWKTSAAV